MAPSGGGRPGVPVEWSGGSADSPAVPREPALRRGWRGAQPPLETPSQGWAAVPGPAALGNASFGGGGEGVVLGCWGIGGVGRCGVSVAARRPARWGVLVKGLRLMVMVKSRRFLGWFDLI